MPTLGATDADKVGNVLWLPCTLMHLHILVKVRWDHGTELA